MLEDAVAVVAPTVGVRVAVGLGALTGGAPETPPAAVTNAATTAKTATTPTNVSVPWSDMRCPDQAVRLVDHQCRSHG